MLVSAVAVGLLAIGSFAQPQPRQSSQKAVAHFRNYFYAGGYYYDVGNNSHVFKDQAYVEQLTPVSGSTKPYPLVFIHGNGQTGTNFLNKPDGGSGWSDYFLAQGYELYIIDQPFRARSPWLPGNGTYSLTPAEQIQWRFTAVQDYNLWPQAALHTQWNGSGVMGDPVFDAFYASNIQSLTQAVQVQKAVQAAGAALLDRIGKPVILIGHSQGGIMPWLIADARPDLTRAIVALEPSGPPFQEAVFTDTAARAYGLSDAPLTYEPAVKDPGTDIAKKTTLSSDPAVSNCTLQSGDSPRQLVNLTKIPVVVVTSEASYHAVYDWCTVEYLKQAGVNATHIELAKNNIHGNGHMFFLEKNSDDIAELVQRSIEQL